MTNKRFFSALRDYAALARRKRTSYAAPVKRLVELRMEELKLTPGTSADYEDVLQGLRDVVSREYAPFDREFSWDGES